MSHPKMLNIDCIVQRDNDVNSAEVDEDIVMVDVEQGSYYGVSDVARTIWEAIEEPRKISDLIDELVASYDVDRSSCEEQTLGFLESLANEHLLKVKNGPTC